MTRDRDRERENPLPPDAWVELVGQFDDSDDARGRYLAARRRPYDAVENEIAPVYYLRSPRAHGYRPCARRRRGDAPCCGTIRYVVRRAAAAQGASPRRPARRCETAPGSGA